MADGEAQGPPLVWSQLELWSCCWAPVLGSRKKLCTVEEEPAKDARDPRCPFLLEDFWQKLEAGSEFFFPFPDLQKPTRSPS